MILTDGTRSDRDMTDLDTKKLGFIVKTYDHFMPANRRITKVTVIYSEFITGFMFHFSCGYLWSIGHLAYDTRDSIDVVIADDEIIVDFSARSDPKCPAKYTEFQFITAKLI